MPSSLKPVIMSLCAAAAFVALPTADAPARPLERHFGAWDSCYARVYSQNHLNKNQGQKVAEIRFDHFPTTFGTYDQNGKISFDPASAEVHFGVSVRFRGDDREYTNGGTCRPDGETYHCYIECDGGSFRLKHRSQTSILLINGSGFAVSGCGSEDYRMLDPEPDDKVFRLDRLNDSACVPPKSQ